MRSLKPINVGDIRYSQKCDLGDEHLNPQIGDVRLLEPGKKLEPKRLRTLEVWLEAATRFTAGVGMCTLGETAVESCLFDMEQGLTM